MKYNKQKHKSTNVKVTFLKEMHPDEFSAKYIRNKQAKSTMSSSLMSMIVESVNSNGVGLLDTSNSTLNSIQNLRNKFNKFEANSKSNEENDENFMKNDPQVNKLEPNCLHQTDSNLTF